MDCSLLINLFICINQIHILYSVICQQPLLKTFCNGIVTCISPATAIERPQRLGLHCHIFVFLMMTFHVTLPTHDILLTFSGGWEGFLVGGGGGGGGVCVGGGTGVAVGILEGVGFISDEILCIYNETSKGFVQYL